MDLYDEDLEFAVQYGDNEIFFPDILKRTDNSLVISKQYGITEHTNILTENFKNVVLAQAEDVIKVR